jgi:TetR/AcrR family transcriptional regulator, regulator of biofilm formation and stress response
MTADELPGSSPVPRTRRRRGAKRRLELLEATLRVLAREGSSAVTMRAVAAEAGVPTTATTYYFESKQDLLLEVWRLHAEREAARVAEAIDAMPVETSPKALGGEMAGFVHESLGPGRDRLLAEIELLLEAARQSELEQLTRVWHQAIRERMRVRLSATNSPNPDLDARLVLAVMAGLELDNLASVDTATMADLREIFTRLFEALYR